MSRFTKYSLQAVGILTGIKMEAITQRTILTGSASYLDLLILAPGIHLQQAASELNVGELPLSCDMHSSYVFRVQNPATIRFLLRISKTGRLTKITVSPPYARRSDLPTSTLDIILYTGGGIVTVITIGILLAIADRWALCAVFSLLVARLLNILVIKQRSELGWKGAFEGHDTEILIVLSGDRWVRMRGAINDIKSVTAGVWLRTMTDMESFVATTATLLVHSSSILAFNASPIGNALLAIMLVSGAALLGFVNSRTTELHMFRHVVSAVDEPTTSTIGKPKKSTTGRLDVIQELILEHASDAWAIALGLVPQRPHPTLRSSNQPMDTHNQLGARVQYFTFGNTTLQCDLAPWEHGQPSTQLSKDLLQCIGARMRTNKIMDLRDMLWGTVMMAKYGELPDNNCLFTRNSPNRSFILCPVMSSPSDVPLQSLHVSPYAIPDDLANVTCISDTAMGVEELLDRLNHVFGTDYPLSIPGLHTCILHVKDALIKAYDRCDIGYMYGFLRPYWHLANFANVPKLMDDRNKEDHNARKNAVEGHCIKDPHIPPRRLWDLYSNRVLPFSALPLQITADSNVINIADHLWAISHSWVDEQQQQTIKTPINAEQWEVRIPKGTNLANVRIELLNMGAEYVWLDVLCLRQYDENSEQSRKDEWKLDVPTIGNIYSAPSRICVIYFNGLGLPLHVSANALRSKRHWFNRVWTLQELCANWLPGGLTGSSTAYERSLFARLIKLREIIDAHGKQKEDKTYYNASQLWKILRDRHCTKEVDRIASLTYLISHDTLPVYDESLDLLVKNLHSKFLTWLFLGAPEPNDLDINELKETEMLQLKDCSSEPQRYNNSRGSFYHTTQMLPPCRILPSSKDARREWQGEEEIVELWFQPNTLIRIEMRIWGAVRPDVAYRLLGVGPDMRYWILATSPDFATSQDLKPNSDGRLPVLEWGVVQMAKGQGQKLVTAGLKPVSITVLYDEALRNRATMSTQTQSLYKLKSGRSSLQRLCEDMPLDFWGQPADPLRTAVAVHTVARNLRRGRGL